MFERWGERDMGAEEKEREIRGVDPTGGGERGPGRVRDAKEKKKHRRRRPPEEKKTVDDDGGEEKKPKAHRRMSLRSV